MSTFLTLAIGLFLFAWITERSRRKYEEARANAFDALSVKLKARLRAELLLIATFAERKATIHLPRAVAAKSKKEHATFAERKATLRKPD